MLDPPIELTQEEIGPFLKNLANPPAPAANQPDEPKAGEMESIKAIFMRHHTIVAGCEFANKFDLDAIAAEIIRTLKDKRPEPKAGRREGETK